MAKSPRDCPCFSGARYATCCAPLHRGAHEAATPEQLLRSRYAAFALGLTEYLFRTLTEDHPYREVPREMLIQELAVPHQHQRFMGLKILHEATKEADSEILFYARIFEKGVDHSFVELSRFARVGDAWRFASGVVIGTPDLPEDLESLTPEDVRREGTSSGLR